MHGVDFNDVFSPVVKHTSIRVLLSLIATKDLELKQLDVKTTFLHGDLEEQIYMRQSEGFEVANEIGDKEAASSDKHQEVYKVEFADAAQTKVNIHFYVYED